MNDQLFEYDRSFLFDTEFEFVVMGDTHFILDPEPYAVEFDSVRQWPHRAAYAWRCVAGMNVVAGGDRVAVLLFLPSSCLINYII